MVSADEQLEAVALIARYARLVDAADVPAIIDCLTEDVSLEYEGGRLTVSGHAPATVFFTNALTVRSTHLLSNFGVERVAGELIVKCAGVAFVCRKDGLVTTRGLSYEFECVRRGHALKVRRLRHSLQWESDSPGGPR